MENNPSPHIFLIPLKFRGKTLLGLAQLSVYIFILMLSFGVPCWYCLTQINGLPYLLSDSIPWCAKFLIVEIYLFIHLLLSFRVTFIHYGFIIYMHSFNWCSLMCLFGIVCSLISDSTQWIAIFIIILIYIFIDFPVII